ncbi:hypothetical protein [Paenibacillus sp. SN-8-1]|uniref:hypothetical protein n=1 Tax=Paenibacillus sp. SN-8-1 TaxID=3435409 RepID=UPI003D9A698E
MAKTYYTDGINEFVALHGLEEAACIVSKVLGISARDARKRIEVAQKHSRNEI